MREKEGNGRERRDRREVIKSGRKRGVIMGEKEKGTGEREGNDIGKGGRGERDE